MMYDLFEFFYPMPDDIAQSILIAETESEIHLRPTNINAKKLWLFNKIIKNLLTNRKTLIVLDNPLDAQILKDFVEEIKLEKLIYFFIHSRSNNEKQLREFKPIIVSGRLQNEEFKIKHQQVQSIFSEFTSSHQALHQKLPGHSNSLFQLYINALHLRQELHPYTGFQATTNELSIKEYNSLKRNLDYAIKISRGSDKSLSCFDLLHANLFDMFEEEEAWQTIEQHIEHFKNTLFTKLNQIQIYKDSWIHTNLNKIQSKILAIHRKYKTFALADPTDQFAQAALVQIRQQLIENLEFLGSPKILLNVDELIKLNADQLLLLCSQYINQRWIEVGAIEPEEENLKNQFSKLLIEIEDICNACNAKSIIKLDYSNRTDLFYAKTSLLKFIRQFNEILRLKQYFSIYFDWKKFYLSCSESQRNFLDDASYTFTSKWYNLLDLTFTEKQIEQSNIAEGKTINLRLQQLKESVDQYNSCHISYIYSQHETRQHKAIKEITSRDSELYNLLIQHQGSEYTIADYYRKLNDLSDIFPVIILENIKEEYIQFNNNSYWDEVLVLTDKIQTNFKEKLLSTSHRYISLFDTHRSDSSLEIALTQSPPDILKSILHSNDTNSSINAATNLVKFIFASFKNCTALLNNNRLILTFLPKELIDLLLQLQTEEFNVFILNEDKDLERLTDWLTYKPTHKSFWTLDSMVSQDIGNIQQIGWQQQFIKCLKLAGLEQENILSENLISIYNIWTWPRSNRAVKLKQSGSLIFK